MYVNDVVQFQCKFDSFVGCLVSFRIGFAVDALDCLGLGLGFVVLLVVMKTIVVQVFCHQLDVPDFWQRINVTMNVLHRMTLGCANGQSLHVSF